MPHTLICGMTESGKTTLARKLARIYQRAKTPVLVLDPYRSAKWNAQYITSSPETFEKVVKASRSCALFVDEAGHWCSEGYEHHLKWLATNSRHYGHNCHFITQRAVQVSPTIRTQCSNVFLFKNSHTDARELAREFVADELLEAHSLKKGEYLGKVGVDGKVYQAKIF